MNALQNRWFTARNAGLVAVSLAIGAAASFALQFIGLPSQHEADVQADHGPAEASAGAEQASKEVIFPEAQWETSGIKIHSATMAPINSSVKLTGKIALNEDRVAHIYPMVEGVVDRVDVQLGQRVHEKDLLVMIHSREIGQAKLELYQARLSQELTRVKDERLRQIALNTNDLISALRQNVPIEEIEPKFRDRAMGDYRQQLLSAYANFYKSQTDFARLETLGDRGAVAAKQFVSAEAARNADRATLQACLEQIEQDLKNAQLLSSQAMKEAETRIAVAETSLRILGSSPDEMSEINPAQQGEAISHYAIRAPFNGTVLSKDVTLLEHVRRDAQVLSIADLSTVWVTADVYEEHLPLLQSLADKEIVVRNEAWAQREFKARVFYAGEIMDEASRTIAMRAIADNSDGLLKPGMFVNVILPGLETQPVMQLPVAAIQEHEGAKFVFVHLGQDRFVRTDINLGRSADGVIEITGGLKLDQPVVITGGFVLKSRMLADLMGGD